MIDGKVFAINRARDRAAAESRRQGETSSLSSEIAVLRSQLSMEAAAARADRVALKTENALLRQLLSDVLGSIETASPGDLASWRERMNAIPNGEKARPKKRRRAKGGP
jgi:predicted secreted protein